MKKCNRCHAVVREEHECPICQSTLTYEPPCHDQKEHYPLNRYYVRYILKNSWFSLLCCIPGIVQLCISSFSTLLLCAWALWVLSLLLSVFQRNIETGIIRKYSEDYAHFKIGLWKYLFGIISITLFCVAD